ncbi:MAG TPA: zinc ribbon domain-containing protein [Pyrinomonadaceae bacterium]|nr:zinc ribbon domain-containing protein [Pyrinomonadaceae bacterium]
METPFILLIILLVLGAIVTVVGHAFWLVLAALFRAIFDQPPSSAKRQSAAQPQPNAARVRCPNCGFQVPPGAPFCPSCGLPKPSELRVDLLTDLAATKRQLERFRDAGRIDADTLAKLKIQLDAEEVRLREARPAPQRPPVEPFEVPVHQVTVETPIEVPLETQPEMPGVTASFVATDDEIVIKPTPSFLPPPGESPPPPADGDRAGFAPSYVPERAPRKSFAEMLNAFMEESNIRWGEIVGGLLIIGCSTALVISLWSEISQIPVLKFLIFTTVTAALFGVGLYTEHRWKLPTTSRGILTISTLLVPLNFLAIAAVSGTSGSPGLLIIASELIAPAVFLCLVYFAGRVLTPSWPHLLGAGVLGSSIGQLLVRHFASAEQSPVLLVALGAFPVACYVASVVWMLKKILADSEIDESETIAAFISLGAMTFAAILPFGLLLYKSGPMSISMMYLAPLVSLGGFPLLATGTLLWQLLSKKEFVASRTAGTSIAILGVLIVLSGMILAWPNPASIVPAALFNFGVFTALAVLLNVPRAHLLAAACFALAYLVLFHVMAGHIAWQNLRVASLLYVSTSVSSGQALAALFVLFLGACEWLARNRRSADSKSYLIAACGVALISLALVAGVLRTADTYVLWPVFAIYALGAFWIATRTRRVIFSWIGSFLLLLSLFEAFALHVNVFFPWQAAMLTHASICTAVAIAVWNYKKDLERLLTRPLSASALMTSFAAVVLLFQAREWQTTAMEAERVFWLAGIWLALLWVVRQRILFTAFQVALTSGVVLMVKGVLQQYAWYAYLPHAFLHPWGLQIQGTALLVLGLVWVSLRFLNRAGKLKHEKIKFIGPLLEAPWAFDRLVTWGLLAVFLLLAIYGALPGVTRELTAQGVDNPSWNIAGFPHQEAFGIGSWIVLALLVIALLANAWEQRRAVYIVGAVAALTSIPPLIAGTFETEIATASAWRWVGALFLILGVLPLLYRERAFAFLRSFGWPETDVSDAELARHIRVLLIGSTIAALLILTIYPALRAIYYMPVHGPAGGIFALLGDTLSYSAPLVIVAAVLIAFSVRERLPVYAFVAGLFLNVTVTMAYLLSVVAWQGSMNRVVVAQAIQLNAITSAIYAMVWLGMRSRWIEKLDETVAKTTERLFKLQISIAVLINAVLIVPVAIRLIARPGWAGIGTIEAGSLSGWAAFILAALSAAWWAKEFAVRLKAEAICAFLICVSCLAAFTAARWEAGNWTGFHTLIAAMAASAWLMCFLRWAPSKLQAAGNSFFSKFLFAEDWEWTTALCATTIGGITILLALLGAFDDPAGSVWSVGTLVSMSILAATLHWQRLRHAYIYAGGLTLALAVLIWSLLNPTVRSMPSSRVMEINCAFLCLASIGWLALELRARRLTERSENDKNASFHNFAALLSFMVTSVVVWLGLIFDRETVSALPTGDPIARFLLASLIALFIACVWDRAARYAVGGLYLCGLLIIGTAIDFLNPALDRVLWLGTLLIGVYTVGASLLWRSRAKVIDFTDRLRIPRRFDPAATELKWLAAFNSISAAIVLLLAFWIVLNFEAAIDRMASALAVIVQAVTFALLAEGVRRLKWQRAAIAAFVVGVVFVGWSFLIPWDTGTWLNRAVILMIEMFAFVALYALLMNKAVEREPDWTAAARACIPWIAVTGMIALAFTLSTEVFYQLNFGTVDIHPLALIAVGATLISGIVICVFFALSPWHDPLSLSERGRTGYVYAAEAMLALLFMHIRLTMPWLFSGFFERYWPLVVMAIAYLGVATSEALRRRGIHVLAHPIERTGAFLPLLPVIGFWIVQSEVDYSALLFIVGGAYGLLSILRRSFVFGILAAVAGNGGLWYLLHRTDNYQFVQHPQLWLIPIALSVLLAVYLNKDDFTEDQMAGIRYMSLVTIYASSTADIFINGVADSPWLPLVLAALSLMGVFSGIIFRIRGLLLLGCVFLLIAIITMIWYASVNLGWTWLWYVAGIATGATIIFMFALFEKKRAEVLRVVEGFKEWQR